MKKLQSVLILLILILTIFSSFNFAFQSASASPPATGDIAWANATASYTAGSNWNQQPSTNLKLWANNNSTATTLDLAPSWPANVTHPYGTQITMSLDNYSYNGTVDARIGGQFEWFMADNGPAISWVYVNLTTSGGTYVWSYDYNFAKHGSTYHVYAYFAPEWNVSAGSFLQSLSFYISYPVAGNELYTYQYSAVGSDSIQQSFLGTQAPLNDWTYGWNYNYKSISSSYSLLASATSYTLNWTSSQKTNTTYNSLTQSGVTSGHFSGSLSVTSVAFQADFMDISSPDYSISYFLNENTTAPATATYGAEDYIYGISENGNFFNSTPIYFNYTIPSGASASYSISYKVTIGNVTLTNPNAPIENFGLSTNPFTYDSISKSGSTVNIVAYANYSSAQSTNLEFVTTEQVNYYPTIVSTAIGWSGTGSQAELTVNAENVGGGYSFTTESLQVVNVNWGDGSALGDSAIQYGSYDWGFYHNYTQAGTYTVSFQVVNYVGSSNSLSKSATGTYTVTTTIATSPTNYGAISPGQNIWFNYTGADAGLTSLTLQINGIDQFTDSFQSSLSQSVPFAPTYAGTLDIVWSWIAGSVSGSVSLTYGTSTTISATALYVLVNYTYSGDGYSNYFMWSGQPIAYNLTYSYYTWTYTLPGESSDVTIKVNPTWDYIFASPGETTYYPSNATVQWHIAQTDSVSVTFLIKDPPQPASFEITYYPTSAVYDFFGASLSFSDLHTYVNGQLLESDFVNAIIGDTYRIQAYDLVGNLVANVSFYVQYQTSFDNIPVAIYPVTISNQNSTYELGLKVSTQGFSQSFPYISPSGSSPSGYTIWVYPSSYWFNFTYINTGDYQVVQTVPLLRSVSGASFINIAGVTISQLAISQQRNAQNYTNLVENVNITFANEYSKIYNETLGVNVNVNDVNSSVHSFLVSLLTNVSFIKSFVQDMNSSIKTEFTATNDIIDSFQSNLTVLTTYVNDTVSYLKSLLTSVNQNLTIEHGIVNETLFIAKQNFTAIGSSIQNNYNSLISSQEFQNSLMNVTINNLKVGLNYSNNLINSTSDNLDLQVSFVNDTLKIVKNLEVQFNSNLTIVNSSIAELEFLSKQRSIYLNDTVAADYQSTLQNVTLEYSYLKGMNVTTLDQLVAIQSVVGAIKNNLTITQSYVNDTVTKVDNFVSIVENEILSNITSNSFNITTRETVIKNLVAMDLQETNATFSYRLQFGTPTATGNNFTFPVFVTLFNGQVANITVTNQAWQDMKIFYESGNNNTTLNFTVTGVKAGFFKLTIYNITSAQVQEIKAGQGLITAQGEVKVGAMTNLAAGIIGSQQIQYSPSNIWTEVFGISPPNENNSAIGVLAYLSWLQESYAGRAIYLLVVFAILAYYAIAIDLKLRERERNNSSKGGGKNESNVK